MDLILHINVLL